MILSVISTDVIHYTISPYLIVNHAVMMSVSSSINREVVLAKCQYKQPHGIKINPSKITYHAHSISLNNAMNTKQVIHYRNGIIHRDNNPAVQYSLGRADWMVNGRHHRVGGPAIIKLNRYIAQESFIPSCMFISDMNQIGHEEWYQYGRLHRLDGPAYITDTRREWWVNGKRYHLEKNYLARVKKHLDKLQQRVARQQLSLVE